MNKRFRRPRGEQPQDNGFEGAVTGLVDHVLRESGKGGEDLSQALKVSLEEEMGKLAAQMAGAVAQRVLGDEDVVVLTGRQAVNRSIGHVLRDVARGRQYGKWGAALKTFFFGAESGGDASESAQRVWGTIDLEDSGKLLDATQREIIRLRLRISSLEGHLRGHEMEVPPAEETEGPEFDLFSEFKRGSRRKRPSRSGAGALFDEDADDDYDEGEEDDELSARRTRRPRRRRNRAKRKSARGEAFGEEDFDEEDFDEESTGGSRRSAASSKKQREPKVESFFKTLEKAKAELAELKAALEKAQADKELAEQNRDEVKEEAKGLRALLARRETRLTLLERGDTIVPELDDAMREVVELRGRLNNIVRAVRDGLDEKEPLGFFEFAQIERVMDQCAFLLKKIDDALVINCEGYVVAAALYAEVLGDVALNDGIPNYALYEKVNRLRGQLEGVLSFQNQFLREQMAEREAHKEATKTVEVPGWWGWKSPDADEDAEDALVDFMSLLDADYEELLELVEEGDTRGIRKFILRPVLKRFHPDKLVSAVAPEGVSIEQVRADSTSLMQLLVRIERELLSDIDVLNFYLELHEINGEEVVTWEEIYPAMAAFMESKEEE
jgi:hypothetical protein